MKYPKLRGICAKLIKENKCTGCNKLENPSFVGLDKCKYFEEKEYKQERIKL